MWLLLPFNNILKINFGLNLYKLSLIIERMIWSSQGIEIPLLGGDKLFKCPHPRISINVFWFITSRAGHLLLLKWKRTPRKQSN